MMKCQLSENGVCGKIQPNLQETGKNLINQPKVLLWWQIFLFPKCLWHIIVEIWTNFMFEIVDQN